jgi:hypothetical protein
MDLFSAIRDPLEFWQGGMVSNSKWPERGGLFFGGGQAHKQGHDSCPMSNTRADMDTSDANPSSRPLMAVRYDQN